MGHGVRMQQLPGFAHLPLRLVEAGLPQFAVKQISLVADLIREVSCLPVQLDGRLHLTPSQQDGHLT